MSEDPYQEFREKFQALAERLIASLERIDLILTKKGEDLADDVEQWLKERS